MLNTGELVRSCRTDRKASGGGFRYCRSRGRTRWSTRRKDPLTTGLVLVRRPCSAIRVDDETRFVDAVGFDGL